MERAQKITADMGVEALAKKLGASKKQVMYLAESVAEMIDTDSAGRWQNWSRDEWINIVEAYVLKHQRRERDMCDRVYTNDEAAGLLQTTVLYALKDE